MGLVFLSLSLIPSLTGFKTLSGIGMRGDSIMIENHRYMEI
jgi:hypothetical protein